MFVALGRELMRLRGVSGEVAMACLNDPAVAWASRALRMMFDIGHFIEVGGDVRRNMFGSGSSSSSSSSSGVEYRKADEDGRCTVESPRAAEFWRLRIDDPMLPALFPSSHAGHPPVVTADWGGLPGFTEYVYG